MTFPSGAFDPESMDYIGLHSAVGTETQGFFPGGNFTTPLSGYAYDLGEPLGVPGVGLDQQALTDAGFPSTVSGFQSNSQVFETNPGGLSVQVKIDHGQQGSLEATEENQFQNFLSALRTQIIFETIASEGAGSPTLELVVAFDSLLQMAGLIGASEGITFDLIEFERDLSGFAKLFSIEGFYFVDSNGPSAMFGVYDGMGMLTEDLSPHFTFAPTKEDGAYDVAFHHAMEFEADPDKLYGVSFNSDIGLDTFGVGSVQLFTAFTASTEVNVVTPGASLIVNGVIPEPASLTIVALAVCVLVGRRRCTTR